MTGASSGIGEAIALAFGEAGADVAVNDVSKEDKAEAVARKIRHGGRRALSHRADASKEDEVRAMFGRVIGEFGTLDILVANAGLQRDAPSDQMTLEQWQRVLAVNLTGQFLCAREALREFKRRSAGNIICISSVHEAIPWAGHANYAASKGGVMMMMKSLAQEVAPLGIRVNGIAPGAICTDINRAAWEEPRAREALLKLIPYRRVGEPADVARAAVWLASDDSDYVVGTTLFVDGGMMLFPAFASGG